MSKKYSDEEIAEDFSLWGEYADPHATMSEREFDELSTEEKIAMLIEMFGSD